MRILYPSSSLRNLILRHHPIIHQTVTTTLKTPKTTVLANNKSQKLFFTSNTPKDTNSSAVLETKHENDTSTSPPTVAKFKNPIVEQLWVARHKAKLMSEQKQQQQNEAKIQNEEVSKFPSESETFIDYPFSSNEFLRESYRVGFSWINFNIGILIGRLRYVTLRYIISFVHKFHHLIECFCFICFLFYLFDIESLGSDAIW